MESLRPQGCQASTRTSRRGLQSDVSLWGAAIAAVFCVSVAVSAWSAWRDRTAESRAAALDRTRAVGALLRRSAASLLEAREHTALRRIISEASVEQELSRCRISLPDGRILADAQVDRITVADVPEQWSGRGEAQTLGIIGDHAKGSWLVDVPGRGQVVLDVAVPVRTSRETMLSGITAHGLTAGAGLSCLLVLWRFVRSRLRGLGAVGEALRAAAEGTRDPATLEVSPSFGVEAQAWNAMLTERKELEAESLLEEARRSVRSRGGGELNAACDALPHGLILVDGECRANYANASASVLLRKDRESLVGASIEEVIQDEGILDAVRQCATGPTYRRTIREVDAGQFEGGGVLRFIVRPVRREDSGVAMIIIEDVTQQRVAENARNAFLAQATHELRTPLTNILLYVETAQDTAANDPAETARCLTVINEEAHRLERTVQDVLSVSEIEAGSLRVKRDDVDVAAVLKRLEEDYAPRAREKRIAMAFDLAPKFSTLQADRDKVALALHNLLGNAVKYTPEGGQVSLTANEAKGQLVVEVSDSGIGISAEDLPRVFDKFYRAKDARLAKITGSGLGLALAREVIRLHGGEITAQSELNKGSTFTLTLPITEGGE